MKRAFSILGWLVSLACIVILAGLIREHLPSFLALADKPGFMGNFALATVIHLGALVVVAAGWGTCLAFHSGTRLAAWSYVAAFGRTNVFKYLPSNTMHFVARQVIAARLSAKAMDMVRASLTDVAMLASAALVIGGALGTAMPPLTLVGAGGLSLPHLAGLGAVATVAGWGILWILPRARGLRGVAFVTAFAMFAGTRDFWRAAALYAGFFLLNVVALKAIVGAIPDSTGAAVPLLGFAYAASWLLGTVTPGAPAGFGVREGVMILILGPVIGEADATVIATVLRFVNLGGELALFLLAAALPLPSQAPAEQDNE